MEYLHTMVRVADLDRSLDFYCNKLGLVETTRVELTYNWDEHEYQGGRNFGHLAYRVDDIYETCRKLMAAGVTINRPPRDGNMAFVRSPDNISIELLQRGEAKAPAEPWASMPNTGVW